MKQKYILPASVLTLVMTVFFFGCKEDEVYPETRLFRPVLNKDLKAEGNSIIVNMGSMKKAVSYTLEVSRDTFKTLDYTLQSDTSYVVINTELLKGDPLYWNTLYQIRATAHAADPAYDSRVSILGSVRTERFPTILNLPTVYDVTDVGARVSWTVAGSAATRIVVYAPSDLKLTTPLLSFDLSEEAQKSGEAIIDGLTPSTSYQVALYSEDLLRGWVDYTTRVPDIDAKGPGVIDIREDTSPQAVVNAVAAAPTGAILLVKRGVVYDMPTVALDKSITIRAAYGFGAKRAQLHNTNGNWNIAGGATIDHIRFIGLEIRGDNFPDAAGTYVFNPNSANIKVREILFEDCIINTMRGVMRIRNTNVVIENFTINNCVVDSIGTYGVVTADTDPTASVPNTARFDNLAFTNSTFNHLILFVNSKTNSKTLLIDNCTFSNQIAAESTNTYFLNYRHTNIAGNNNVTGGITIRNSIFGPAWKQGDVKTNNFRGKNGLPATPIDVSGNYATSDWDFLTGYEIPGLRSLTYSGTQTDLWVDPGKTNFTFKDLTFPGRFTAGDPRWRVRL